MKNSSDQYLDIDYKNIAQIKDSIRAVFEAYKRRTRDGIVSGLETVIIDRLVLLKKYQKHKKSGYFKFFLFISSITIFSLTYFGYYKSFSSIYLLVFISILIGLLSSFVNNLYLRGMTPIKSDIEVVGFKKALNDIYFETYSSVQIIYYQYFATYLLFMILIFAGDNFETVLKLSDFINEYLRIFFSRIISDSMIIIVPQFKYYLYFICTVNIAYILGDFLFIFFYYNRSIKKDMGKKK